LIPSLNDLRLVELDQLVLHEAHERWVAEVTETFSEEPEGL